MILQLIFIGSPCIDILPPITVQHLEGYFLLRAGIDKEAVADIQSIKKGQLLFESDRIQTCSFLNNGINQSD